MKKLLFILAFLLCLSAFSQNPARFRSGIDVEGTIILRPQGAPGTPVDGEIYYDTTTKTIWVYNGTIWTEVGSGTLEALTQAQFDALTAPQQAAYTGLIVDAGGPATYVVLNGNYGTPTSLVLTNATGLTSTGIINGAVQNVDIADDTIKEVKLDIFNTATDGYVLTWDTTNELQWEAQAVGISRHPDSPVAIDSIYVGTTAQIDAANLGTDVIAFPTDGNPMSVIATGDWDTANGAVTMVSWQGVDDRTIDEATITLSDCDPGEALTVYINRATAPTLAGTGLTFNDIGTVAFAAATEQKIEFEVAIDGTTIDYFYVNR